MNQIKPLKKRKLNYPWKSSPFCSLSTFIIIIGLLGFSSIKNEIYASPFAELVTLVHACGGEGGIAEFEVLGDPSNFSWYWTHGPTDLRLEDLAPGTYTFVIKELSTGCAEEYDVTILDKDNCLIDINPIVQEHCQVLIQITILSGGDPVPESALEIIWSDGDPSGLNRIVQRGCYETNVYCVSISLIEIGDVCCSGNEGCCSFYECIPIEGSKRCCQERVIVNEFDNPENGEEQFLELLVLGNEICGETADLRGIQIDDNDGYIISGNNFINALNTTLIGAQPGYLSFSHHPNWEAVPNGSLIVIYPSGARPQNMPLDDPTDSNQDFVYVLSAEDLEYFAAKEGIWNSELVLLEMGGSSIDPSWEAVKISEMADGMQVRWDDGSYMHGLSLGSTNFSITNVFPLWMGEQASGNCNCRFTGTDYRSKTHFECSLTVDNFSTPGLANSIDNQALIDSLTNCSNLNNATNRHQEDDSDFQTLSSEELWVFPNPFKDEIILKFRTEIAGEVNATILSIAGQQIATRQWLNQKGDNEYPFRLEEYVPSGVVILQFTFPSGEKVNRKIIRMNTE